MDKKNKICVKNYYNNCFKVINNNFYWNDAKEV